MRYFKITDFLKRNNYEGNAIVFSETPFFFFVVDWELSLAVEDCGRRSRSICFFLFFSIYKLRLEACPFGSGLRKFTLDPVIVIFSKNIRKITTVGLIQSL